MDVVRSWPPVTRYVCAPAPILREHSLILMLIRRTLVVGSLLTSVGVYSGLIPFLPLIFIPGRLLAFPPQIWRLVTSFFITGPKMGIIFDPYFLYQYGSQLETGSARFSEPGAFFTYIVFNGLVIVVSPRQSFRDNILLLCLPARATSKYLPAQSL